MLERAFYRDASRVRRASRPLPPPCRTLLSASSRRPSVRCTTTSAASARPAQPRTLRLAPRRGAAGKADTLDLSARIFTYDAEKGPQRLAEMKRLVAQVRQRRHGAAGIMQAWRKLTHAQINEIQAAHPPAEVRQSRALLSHVSGRSTSTVRTATTTTTTATAMTTYAYTGTMRGA